MVKQASAALASHLTTQHRQIDAWRAANSATPTTPDSLANAAPGLSTEKFPVEYRTDGIDYCLAGAVADVDAAMTYLSLDGGTWLPGDDRCPSGYNEL